MVFYDKYGNPCCYSDDYVHIYSYDGKPLGYILNNKVWNYNGRYLGQFLNNWVLDKEGYYVFFTEIKLLFSRLKYCFCIKLHFVMILRELKL